MLVKVTVMDEANQEMKREAIQEMARFPVIPQEIATDILGELSALDWELRPDLWRTYPQDEANQNQVLDAFRNGDFCSAVMLSVSEPTIFLTLNEHVWQAA